MTRRVRPKISKSRTYIAWSNMKNRCRNPNLWQYKYYGGKGISYDPKWETFEGFLQDMGEKPPGKNHLDRIDNSKGYCKENCRWSELRVSYLNRAIKGGKYPTGIRPNGVGRWGARITIYGVEYHIGNFGSIEEACAARKVWEEMYQC